MNLRRWLGGRGERAAARALRRAGLRIVCSNYRCPLGQLDLVALDGDTLVFVEVKSRSAPAEGAEGAPADAGLPTELPVRRKQQRSLERAARHFVLAHGWADRPCRFDVVAVTWPRRGRPIIEHVENAFYAQRP